MALVSPDLPPTLLFKLQIIIHLQNQWGKLHSWNNEIEESISEFAVIRSSLNGIVLPNPWEAGWGAGIHMRPALQAFLSYGHDVKVLSTSCFSMSALQKPRHPEIQFFSFASFLVSRSVSFISWPVKLWCSSHPNKSMLLECIWVSSLLKGPS